MRQSEEVTATEAGISPRQRRCIPLTFRKCNQRAAFGRPFTSKDNGRNLMNDINNEVDKILQR